MRSAPITRGAVTSTTCSVINSKVQCKVRCCSCPRLCLCPPPHIPRRPASFLSKRLNINAATVNLAIWDTAGQERFHALGPIYYRDADGDYFALAACVRKFAFHIHSYVYIDIGLFFLSLAWHCLCLMPALQVLFWSMTSPTQRVSSRSRIGSKSCEKWSATQLLHSFSARVNMFVGRLETTLLLPSQATRAILKKIVRSRFLQPRSTRAAWAPCTFPPVQRPTKAPTTFFWTSASA